VRGRARGTGVGSRTMPGRCSRQGWKPGGGTLEGLWGDLTGTPLTEDSEWIGVAARASQP